MDASVSTELGELHHEVNSKRSRRYENPVQLGHLSVWRLNLRPKQIKSVPNQTLGVQVLPGSRQLPRRVEELDGVSFGPLGENGLLGDEAVSAVGGALVKKVLGALVPTSCLVVMIRNLSVAV